MNPLLHIGCAPLLGLGALVLLLGGAPARSAESVVELPPLLVTESIPLRWRYLQTDDAEALFVCPDATAREFLASYHRLNQLLHVLVPAKFLVKNSAPTTFILFDSSAKKMISAEVVREMVREQHASSAAVRNEARMAQQTVTFMPNMRLRDRDTSAAFFILDDSAESPRFQFTPDYFTASLARRAPVLPLWLIHGLIRLYETVHFEADAILFAPLSWTSAGETGALIRDPDYPRALLPLEEVLALSPADYQEDTEFTRLWRAEAALLIRWAIASKDPARRAALWKFVERLEQEPLSETLFRDCFGLGYSDMRDRLSDYLPRAVAEEFALPAGTLATLKVGKSHPASETEIGRLRGEWERLEIQHVKKAYPALADKYLEQARRTLERAYAQDDQDPRLLAVYGLCEAEAGNPVKARELLEKAVQGRVLRPRAHFELARLKFTGKMREGTAQLDDAAAAEILQLLQTAVRQDPPLEEAYLLMAEVGLKRSRPPTDAELASLHEGVRLFPHATPLVARVVTMYATQGRLGPAKTLAAFGLRHAPTVRDRKFYAELGARLDAMERPK